MTTQSPASQANLRKFQDLLRDLFQFDCADLDFGIYRIMNHKRDAIANFISQDLPKRIAADLEKGALDRQARAAANLEEARQNVVAALGRGALDADGKLADSFHGIPIGKAYLGAQAAAAPGRSHQAVEADTYNHLYTFFSRYYQDGDFISRRRYGRNQRYAIPYNGEEVYLHWANSDQYYVKTAEHFHNYDWKAPNGVTVHFRLQAADVEQNNVKGDRRFFLPQVEQTAWDADTRAVTIPFEYRPLTVPETGSYGARNQQDNIIEAAVAGIPQQLDGETEAQTALTRERRRNAGDEPVTYLEHHLRQYTKRNESDFFIHKDLHAFLSRELDFYLKNEVLNLDNLENAGENAAGGWFQQMRLIKSVGGEIIDFLAQIEGFQKMLWEKRKFVVETHYCVTLANADSCFYREIASNDAQWEEWCDLLDIDGSDRSDSFLDSHPTLPLDTRHFDASFTDRLLASFDDLDGQIDGLLVHSDNWQALNLLTEHHREGVRCIYIDPPFNTETDEFLYKDGYPHSSWLAMMESRVQISQHLLANDGTFYAHIDYTEKERLKLLFDRYLSYITEIIWRIGWVSGYKSAANKFIRNHDTIFQYGKTDSPLFIKTYIPYPEEYMRRDGSPPSGKGYPLEDTWNCSEMDQLNSIQIMSFSKEKIGNQALTQKNEGLVARMMESSTRPGDVTLDYFLGSGTTAAVAHKMGRRYIGVEMDEQFLTYVLPRMKRVLFGDPYGISSAYNWEGGGAFKYIRLESYEDALDGIAFDDDAGRMDLQSIEGYLLKYMLKWETKHSETLLNAAKLTRPFDYRLRANANGVTRERTADVPETFAYLLGLNVRKRQVCHDGGRRYLVYRGETRDAPGRSVAVIWRKTEGWTQEDFARDRKFVKAQGFTDADAVYVNGDSVIPNAKAVEPIFKKRMFAGVQP